MQIKRYNITSPLLLWSRTRIDRRSVCLSLYPIIMESEEDKTYSDHVSDIAYLNLISQITQCLHFHSRVISHFSTCSLLKCCHKKCINSLCLLFTHSVEGCELSSSIIISTTMYCSFTPQGGSKETHVQCWRDTGIIRYHSQATDPSKYIVSLQIPEIK